MKLWSFWYHRHQFRCDVWFCRSHPCLLGKTSLLIITITSNTSYTKEIILYLFARWPYLSTGRWVLTRRKGEVMMNTTTIPTQDTTVSYTISLSTKNYQSIESHRYNTQFDQSQFPDPQTNRRHEDNSLSDKILEYTDSLGNIIDSFGNAIDVRPTISRMGKGFFSSYPYFKF